MQYAIIRSGGKQYKVSEGDTLTVDKIIGSDEQKSLVFDDVLMVVNDGKISVGKPTVNGVKVEASVIENKKGDKIKVIRFKAKSRYRRTIGFRSHQTVVKIDKIGIVAKETPKKSEKSTKTATKE